MTTNTTPLVVDDRTMQVLLHLARENKGMLSDCMLQAQFTQRFNDCITRLETVVGSETATTEDRESIFEEYRVLINDLLEFRWARRRSEES